MLKIRATFVTAIYMHVPNAFITQKIVLATLLIALILLKRARNQFEGSNKVNRGIRLSLAKHKARTLSLLSRDKQHQTSAIAAIYRD